MNKKLVINIILVLMVVLVAYSIINSSSDPTPKDIAECIGSKSLLYVQLGCHACKAQEDLFGENYKYLNVVDCFFEENKCPNIRGTPTWVINGKEYVGVQTIDFLKNQTGC